ncbi:MAG: phosphate acyltransferase PlsX [Pseudomonadota bacterium]
MTEKTVTIALDAMGGDHAPHTVIAGAALAAKDLRDMRFLLFGDQNKLAPLLDAGASGLENYTIHHCDDVIAPDQKPSSALRHGKQSSMAQAIQAVGEGRADCVVSAGNTGALMALTMFGLKRLEGVSRPAIIATFPGRERTVCMLDLGANVEADAHNLVQFAIMGDCFARHVIGLDQPKLGLLNVGSEESKGLAALREAANILRDGEIGVNFHGFVEGDDIFNSTVDVIITDGFTGNVALKTMEGTVRFIASLLRGFLRSSFLTRLGLMLTGGAFRQFFRQIINPGAYNGAVFLGLNGIAVKSHGNANAASFANAIKVAASLVHADFNEHIREGLGRLARKSAK